MTNKKIERQEIKIEKKTPQMSDGFKVLKKDHFSPQTSYIICICFLNIFSIQFWYKSLFLLFNFVLGLREARERERLLDSNGKERKILLLSILVIKMIDFYVKEFDLI